MNKYAAAVTSANYTYALMVQYSKRQSPASHVRYASEEYWAMHMGEHCTIGGDPGGVSYVQVVITIFKFLLLDVIS